ncbi:PerC family transcriptional regulator [Escherichia coli]|nr:PerC family transcriptional regulator [Escherichia coli]MED8162199.1 PerC family transcriptional regulator [Escherichia coli]
MTSLKTSIKTITYLSDIGCLEIQGASLLQEDDRICIQIRIQHCLKRAKMKSQRATSQEEFSFRLLRSSAIQTEKEMGIYRDRKTAHDHLYRQDGKKSPH